MKKIFMQQWLHVNNRKHTVDTDTWYLHFANGLLPVLKTSACLSTTNEEQYTHTALALTLYLQDSIAQTGGWITFKEAYQSLYQTELPFYPTGDDYIANEVKPQRCRICIMDTSCTTGSKDS